MIWKRPSPFLLLMISFQMLLVPVMRNQPTRENDLDTFLTEQVARNHLPGLAVAITRGNQVVYLKGFGQDSSNGPVTPQTQFFLASVSKTFTGLAVMKLAEAGKIELDTPVQHYLPDFTLSDERAARITVRDLLNHTSGLADQGFQELRLPQAKTPEERVKMLKKARFVSDPGKEFHYFNPNYEILARVVEVTSGEPFPDHLRNHLFTPLEMKDTFDVNYSDDAYRQASAMAEGHYFAYTVPIRAKEFSGYIGGSGGVISTAEDMARYLMFQNQAGEPETQSVISPKSLEITHTPPEGIQTNYGMGWFQGKEDGLQTLEHNGVFSAYYSDVVLIPEQKIGIALLYNSSSLAANAIPFPEIRRGLIALVTGKPVKTGRFQLIHYGLITGILTLMGVALSARSLLRLDHWNKRKDTTNTWLLIAGIFWKFIPALFTLGMPWLVAAGSGRFFGYSALFRSMPEIFIWLGATGLMGAVNGVLRICSLVYRKRS